MADLDLVLHLRGNLFWVMEARAEAEAEAEAEAGVPGGVHFPFRTGGRGRGPGRWGRAQQQPPIRGVLQTTTSHSVLPPPPPLPLPPPRNRNCAPDLASGGVRGSQGCGEGRRRRPRQTRPPRWLADGCHFGREEEVEVRVGGAEPNNNLPYGVSSKQQPPIARGPLPLPPPRVRKRPPAHPRSRACGGDDREGRNLVFLR